MKKGFYVSRKNKEDLISASTVVLFDGEKLFMVRYKPMNKEFYLCDNDTSSYEGIYPVVEILDDIKQRILSNDELITYHGEFLDYECRSYNVGTRPWTYHMKDVSFRFENNKFTFEITNDREVLPEEYFNSRRIFIDGALCCSVSDCSGDCEGYAYIDKEWFDNNYLEITGFKNEDSFYCNYLYPDSEKILDKAVEANTLIGMRPCLDCKEFCPSEKLLSCKGI